MNAWLWSDSFLLVCQVIRAEVVNTAAADQLTNNKYTLK